MDSTDDPPIEGGLPNLSTAPDLRDRLASSWAAGASAVFYGAVTHELCPQIHRYLARRFGFGDDDCDDCTAQVLDRLVERQGTDRNLIHDPYSYIYQAAINAAIQMMKGRSRDGEIADGWCDVNEIERRRNVSRGSALEYEMTDDSSGMDSAARAASGANNSVIVPEEWASVVVEESIGEVEVSGHWAQEIILVAVRRLPSAQRRVVEYLMWQDFDYHRGDLAYQAREAAAAPRLSG